MSVQCDIYPVTYHILRSLSVEAIASPMEALRCSSLEVGNQMNIIVAFINAENLPIIRTHSWNSTVVSDMLTVLSSDMVPMKILFFTGLWTEDAMPSIPKLKKQFLMPYLQLASSLDFITVYADTFKISEIFIRIDIAARKLASDMCVERMFSSTGFSLSSDEVQFIFRVAQAVQKSIEFSLQSISSLCASSRIMESLSSQVSSSHAFSSSMAASKHIDPSSIFSFPSQTMTACKLFPTLDEGISVYEFFSGIGGMHLALPSFIHGVPIRKVTAFDCSAVANQVYKHNFITQIHTDRNCYLREILIEGIKVSELDGDNAADLWTMSPPCQPYTSTRGAHQRGAADNRNKGFYHIMDMLLSLSRKPRWIVLENVAKFSNSDVCELFKEVLSHCGYTFKEFEISPIDLGVPNHRLRYYLIAEYGARFASSKGVICRSLGRGVCMPYPIGIYVLHNKSEYVMDEMLPSEEDLYLSTETLESSWANKTISIVGDYDRTSFCFTKGYGRIIHKSTGSCYLIDAAGPLADPDYQIDRSNMQVLTGRVRLFHPRELLSIAGFPGNYRFPPNMPLLKQYACIGNSINVSVVMEIVKLLFDVH